jgi:hypothetical protein
VQAAQRGQQHPHGIACGSRSQYVMSCSMYCAYHKAGRETVVEVRLGGVHLKLRTRKRVLRSQCTAGVLKLNPMLCICN